MGKEHRDAGGDQVKVRNRTTPDAAQARADGRLGGPPADFGALHMRDQALLVHLH